MDYDFGDDDSIDTKKHIKKRGRKRKNEITTNISTTKKKRKPNIFEIDEKKKLSDQIQDWIDKEWKDIQWTPTQGYILRETCRSLLKEAFQSCSDSENSIYLIEKTAYNKWFVSDFQNYTKCLRNLIFFIEKDPNRFKSKYHVTK